MFTVFLCYNYDCLKNYIMLYLTRMQVAFCLVLLGPLGRRARSRLSCFSRALQHKSRQKDERGCAKVSHKGSHHFQHLWSLSQKRERERERRTNWRKSVCVCVEPSHILFLQAAVCQRQGKKNKKIRTVKLSSEKKSWKSCVKIWNGMHFVCW